ncbi:LacI family transcriptional regulator [Sediminihabitans luteus]|uniref:LacI family transcriptional regulator n=1 Tax=Sediminihabitans luteus TaxID=1138585 RepID=A0A2M9D1B4_9CELL|nr:LacI family DNA-binding transcriptional regulator [Sediminihabitans luteus]PJJ77962.1 LacI family transcriptional regulator [Sediminihabitans luteus]GIJ00591.1 LacI family transcriptional regulator [Sediminihabitans luteus]
MGRVTIQQVAKAANVSPSTVSNLLNGRTERMVPATRERIEAAIAELGYRPNRAARQLRTGRTQTVGLIVPSVGNPFWGAFARELEVAALAVGCSVLLCNSERDPERERRYVEELWEDGVRGIVLCSSLPTLDHLADVVARGLRLVTFDRPAQPGDPDSVVSVSIDNHVGGFLAGSHLTSLGHERLTFVSGSLASVNRTGRFRGFCTALEAVDLDPTAMPLWTGFEDTPFGDVEAAEVGRRAAHALFSGTEEPPTGVVAINDMTALGFCRGLRDQGLRVGSDVSVVGFDDIILADLYDPPLTTIRQPIARMAALALGEVLDDGDREPGRSVLLRPELVVRESSAPPPVGGVPERRTAEVRASDLRASDVSTTDGAVR